jgi:hypothetical protein
MLYEYLSKFIVELAFNVTLLGYIPLILKIFYHIFNCYILKLIRLVHHTSEVLIRCYIRTNSKGYFQPVNYTHGAIIDNCGALISTYYD